MVAPKAMPPSTSTTTIIRTEHLTANMEKLSTPYAFQLRSMLLASVPYARLTERLLGGQENDGTGNVLRLPQTA